MFALWPNEQSFKPDRTRNHELGLRLELVRQASDPEWRPLLHPTGRTCALQSTTQFGGEGITINGFTRGLQKEWSCSSRDGWLIISH